MAMIQCHHGHHYDDRKHTHCPYCPVPGLRDVTAEQISPDAVPPLEAVKAEEEQLASMQLQIESIRDLANEKRLILCAEANARRQRHKRISFASGVLALISGGSAAALLAPMGNFLELKVLSAALALSSGAISLLNTTFYDDKETARMYAGSSSYGDLRARIDVILSRPALTVAEAYRAYERFVDQSSKLNKEHDQLINPAAMREISARVEGNLQTRAQDLKLSKPRIRIYAEPPML
jgi:hypothetical protein